MTRTFDNWWEDYQLTEDDYESAITYPKAKIRYTFAFRNPNQMYLFLVTKEYRNQWGDVTWADIVFKIDSPYMWLERMCSREFHKHRKSKKKASLWFKLLSKVEFKLRPYRKWL